MFLGSAMFTSFGDLITLLLSLKALKANLQMVLKLETEEIMRINAARFELIFFFQATRVTRATTRE